MSSLVLMGNISDLKNETISKVNVLLNYIDANKRKKLLNFYKPIDLYRSLFAEVLLREYFLSQSLLSNNDLVFKKNKYGKPFLKNKISENQEFNISHSGDWIVVGLSSSKIGIDIEKKRTINATGIAKSFFTEKEVELLNFSKNKISSFWYLWTLKESYIKAIGTGMSEGLNNFSIDFTLKKPLCIESGRDYKPSFHSFFNIKNYYVSVCLEQKSNPEWRYIDINASVDNFLNFIKNDINYVRSRDLSE